MGDLPCSSNVPGKFSYNSQLRTKVVEIPHVDTDLIGAFLCSLLERVVAEEMFDSDGTKATIDV